MDGRLQNENKIEDAITRKLLKMPSYVSVWHMNLKASRKTAATRKDLIYKIHAFLSSINTDVMNVTLSDINELNVTKFFLSIQTKEQNGTITYTSDSYQKTIWSALNNFLGYFYERGDIEKNYVQMVTPPQNHDLERINEHRVRLTMRDFKKILEAVKQEKNPGRQSRDMAIILLFMNTGMRRAALASVTLDDVDLENLSLTVIDKGNKRQHYILNDELAEAIRKWLRYRWSFEKGSGDNHLFVSDRGHGLSGNGIFIIVEKYTERGLGRKLSPHKLRAGYCSILYSKTHDIEFVRRAVGHSSSTVTQRYIVTNGDERKTASDIFRNLTI